MPAPEPQEGAPLDAYIIEEIKRREEKKRRDEDAKRPRKELPIPGNDIPEYDPEERRRWEEEQERIRKDRGDR